MRRRHSVYNKLSRCCCGRNYYPTRAHAKGIYASVTNLLHHRIGCRREVFTAVNTVILNLINQLLGMFDANSQSKSLCFQSDAVLSQKIVNVPRRMTSGQHYGNTFHFIPILEHNTFSPAIFDNQIRNSGVKMILAPGLLNCIPYGSNDLWQHVCTNMRMCFYQDFILSTVEIKYFQNFSDISPFFGPGVKFTVGKSPGTAFTISVI